MYTDPAKANVSPTSHLVTGAYNPYTGKEALDILMKRIYSQLREHQDFAPHLTMTKFDFEFTLSFRGELIEPTVIKGKSASALRPVADSFTVTGTSAQAPDDGRREAGLVVPTPTLTTGGMVDIPMQAQVPQS